MAAFKQYGLKQCKGKPLPHTLFSVHYNFFLAMHKQSTLFSVSQFSSITNCFNLIRIHFIMTLFVSEFGFRIWLSIELSIQKRSGSIFACVNVRFVWHFSGDLLRNWLKSLKLFSVLVLLINMRLISMHKHTSSKEKTKFTSFKNCICKYRHLELKCERYISPLNGIRVMCGFVCVWSVWLNSYW